MKRSKNNTTVESLLKAAERLFALHGIESVSTRQISREAGQKNHSALQYHFGNKEELISAILSYRMKSVNEKRLQHIELLANSGKEIDIRGLIEILVLPFAEELLKDPKESYYISLIAQLISSHQNEKVYQSANNHFKTILDISTRLISELSFLDKDIALERLNFMGVQLVHSVAEWDHLRRKGSIAINPDTLKKRSNNLINFLTGGLTAPPGTS